MGSEGAKIQILARIDSIDAVQNFAAILKQADGIVLQRDELAMELDAEKQMLAQKWMIQESNKAAKPIFLQSQILESMITNQIADRQETQDISTAVLDGVDAFILDAETSYGLSPVKATCQLAKAIAEAELIYSHE